MLHTMKAPPNREKGVRIVRCNQQQADILRKVGWTEIPEEDPPQLSEPSDPPRIYANTIARWGGGISPADVTLEPITVDDPDEVRPKADSPYLQSADYKLSELKKPKRTYHRRVVKVEPDGKVNYSIKPAKRRYRRRDLTAEE